MWTIAGLMWTKHGKWIIAGLLFVALLASIYMAITTGNKMIAKTSKESGVLQERATSNEKVIEDVKKANDNANTPTDDARKRRLCEKYDRNRANCQ